MRLVEGNVPKGQLEIGVKTKVLMRTLHKLNGEATADEIYKNIPADIIQEFNWNKKKVIDLLYTREPFYLKRKFSSRSYMRKGNGRHQVYIIKQRVMDWFARQDANKD